jgi:hypothetical protein
MNKVITLMVFLAFLLTTSVTFAGQIKAADTMVFDSTNNYLGACQLTDKSEWELKEDLTVTKFEVWYSWNQGETTLPVKLLLNGEKFAEFEATRGNCDPYQKQWCNADYPINKPFPKGKYSTEIPNARQCLKPGGTGAIRLYAVVQPSPTLTIEPKKNQVTPNEIAPSQPEKCSCNQTTIVLTAVAASVISSLIVTLLLKKV